MTNPELKCLITDLDGTLTIDKGIVGKTNLETLEKLGQIGITRIIATGRSYYSAQKVLDPDFPIDYLIFSSGVGVIDWKTKKLIDSYNIDEIEISKAVNILKTEYADFMIHFPVPDNHNFYYHQTDRNNPDFERRVNLYSQFAEEYTDQKIEKSAQLLAVLHNETDEEFDLIKSKIDFLTIIKTTSPLDDSTIWMELFPKQVSKSKSSERLCSELNFNKNQVLAIGNDFNDEDLLDWAGTSFVVGNAPEKFKNKYETCKPNFENGFTSIIKRFFEI